LIIVLAAMTEILMIMPLSIYTGRQQVKITAQAKSFSGRI
jgi:hypothetical protein